MDKLPVGQLPDLQQSNNDDEIMVITNSEYSQLKKEKISDLITDFTSTNENNALTKGTDGKMFVTDFGNASNITDGTLPVSVLPDIPKDKLPPIETSDLPVSGVSADTYAYPSSVTVNAQGQVTAIEEGTPSGSNANVDLSNITEAGKEVIKENSGGGLEVGDIGMSLYVDETKGLRRRLNGTVAAITANIQGFLSLLKKVAVLFPSIVTTDSNWQAIAAASPLGQCGKFVIQESSSQINYYAYSSTVDTVTTTYFTETTEDSAAVNVYNSTFELQGQGSIASGVLTFNNGTYNRASGSDTSQTFEAYIRFPRIVMPIQNLTDLTKLGEIVEAGLPNITGDFQVRSGSSVFGLVANNAAPVQQGAFYSDGNGGLETMVNATTGKLSTGWAFSAAKSNSIYGNSDTVQQEQVQFPYFIQIATGQETEVNITNEIELNNPFFFGMSQYFDVEPDNVSWLKSAGQWNSKASYPDYYNWLLSEKNTPDRLQENQVKYSTEDYTDYDWVINTTDETFRLPLYNGSEDLLGEEIDTYTVPSADHQTYTALHTGLVQAEATTTAVNQHIRITNNDTREIDEMRSPISGSSNIVNVSVKVGDTFKVSGDNISTIYAVRGIIAKGAGDLYYFVGTAVNNAPLINAGRFAEELVNKVDKDLSNCTPEQEFITNAINWVMPDYSAGVTCNANTTYTATQAGWVCYKYNNNSAIQARLYINGIEIQGANGSNNTSAWDSIFVPVGAGDTYRCQLAFTFYPCKGGS